MTGFRWLPRLSFIYQGSKPAVHKCIGWSPLTSVGCSACCCGFCIYFYASQGTAHLFWVKKYCIQSCASALLHLTAHIPSEGFIPFFWFCCLLNPFVLYLHVWSAWFSSSELPLCNWARNHNSSCLNASAFCSRSNQCCSWEWNQMSSPQVCNSVQLLHRSLFI